MDISSLGVSAREQMAWQERLANTAHVREIADLKAAGLNPVLSAKLGGAVTPSGANDLAQLAALNSAESAASGSGGSGGKLGATSDGSLLGDIINNLNPNSSSRFGKWSIPNWLIQYVYGKAKDAFGDDLNLPIFTEMLNDESGANASPEQVQRTIYSNTYGMDDEGISGSSEVIYHNNKPATVIPTSEQISNNWRSKLQYAWDKYRAKGKSKSARTNFANIRAFGAK